MRARMRGMGLTCQHSARAFSALFVVPLGGAAAYASSFVRCHVVLILYSDHAARAPDQGAEMSVPWQRPLPLGAAGTGALLRIRSLGRFGQRRVANLDIEENHALTEIRDV